MFNSSIVRQPDGKHALYDHKNNTFIIKDATVEEIRDRCIMTAIARIDSDIVSNFTHVRSSHIEGNKDPLFQAALESMRHGKSKSILKAHQFECTHITNIPAKARDNYETYDQRTRTACQG